MRLYVAGPMTGRHRWNFDAFEAAAAELRAAGYEVWSPHERDLAEGFDPDGDGEGFDLLAALEADVQAVLYSDGVALLPGWEHSAGVSVELLTAEAEGLPYRPVSDWLLIATHGIAV